MPNFAQLLAAIKTAATQPVEMFQMLAEMELRAQFVSPFIPTARQKVESLVAFECEDFDVPAEIQHEFVLYCHKHQLGYDDFPSGVRVWDSEKREREEQQFAPLFWEDDKPSLVLVK